MKIAPLSIAYQYNTNNSKTLKNRKTLNFKTANKEVVELLKTEAEKEKILEKIKPIIVEKIGVTKEEVVPKTDLVIDLGCDSIDFVDIILDVEKEYNIKLGTDEELDKVRSVQDLIDLTYSKCSKNK